jgi:hypothetical protein
MRKTAVSALLVVAVLVGAGCRKDSNSPVSPDSTARQGGWTGIITRPGGQPPITAMWDPTQSADGLSGPMTLTSGGISIIVTARGGTSGNDSVGHRIHTSFMDAAGGNAALPGCTVRGNTNGPQEGDPFPSPYTTITVPAFSITYNSCPGFVQGNFLQEIVQITLTKQ